MGNTPSEKKKNVGYMYVMAYGYETKGSEDKG